jgi:hypothetical protein
MEHGFYEDHEYVSSLPADADRADDFEYEARPCPFMFLREVMAEGCCITQKFLYSPK